MQGSMTKHLEQGRNTSKIEIQCLSFLLTSLRLSIETILFVCFKFSLAVILPVRTAVMFGMT